MFDPRIARHLIADQGEVVIDEVRKHWAALVGSVLELLLGVVILSVSAVVPPQAWWVPAILGGAVALHATWRILERRLDRFVVTNMRVFRVHGILSQRIATMPLSRILDISVHKPFVGRVFGYGHFIFESAAQAQGLREIRYVGHPDERGLTIQRVIQQAGLRGFNPQNPHAVSSRPDSIPAQRSTTAPSWDDASWSTETRPMPPIPPRPPLPTFDPDRTTTAPINLPR